MSVRELIAELQKYDADADVTTANGDVTEVIEGPPVKLSDGSEYPIVMLLVY